MGLLWKITKRSDTDELGFNKELLELSKWSLNEIASISANIQKLNTLLEELTAASGLSASDNMQERATKLGHQTAHQFMAFMNDDRRLNTVTFQSLSMVYSCLGAAAEANNARDIYILLTSAMASYLSGVPMGDMNGDN